MPQSHGMPLLVQKLQKLEWFWALSDFALQHNYCSLCVQDITITETSFIFISYLSWFLNQAPPRLEVNLTTWWKRYWTDTQLNSSCLVLWYVTKSGNPEASAHTSRAEAIILTYHTSCNHLEPTAQEERHMPKLFFNQKSHF